MIGGLIVSNIGVHAVAYSSSILGIVIVLIVLSIKQTQKPQI